MFNLGPRGILVLGMHRSGTSAVAGLVNMLGANAPAHPLPPASDNPLGFWESFSLLGINDWILQQAGAAWYDCLQFDAGALDLNTRHHALALITLGVTSEYQGAPLPLIKDPRLCLLLDLWLPALHACKLAPSVLLVRRHPGTVAASLAERDDLPPMLSQALWLRYMLAAEFATRTCPRHILSYDRLLQDWRPCMTLAGLRAGITWPAARDVSPGRLARYLDPRRRRPEPRPASGDHDRTPLSPWLEEAYAALGGLERDGSVPYHLKRLDTVRSAFASWSRAEGGSLTASLLQHHPIRQVPRFEVPPALLDAARNHAPRERVLVD